MIKEKLRREQRVAATILENVLTSGKSAHAYMFTGVKGTPKLEAAILLAQSLLCEEEGFACETCDTCLRVAQGTYADCVMIDGTQTSIKKEAILNLQEQFNMTALEAKGKKIYIMNGVENATLEALNSLLKFLEEPSEDVTAILITEQPDRILPTIRSRCQLIPFYKQSTTQILQDCRSQNLNELDAYILTHLVGNMEQINEMVEDENYQQARIIAMNLLDNFHQSAHRALLELQNESFKEKKGNDRMQMNMILDILMLFFKDCLKQKTDCTSDQWNQLCTVYQNKNCMHYLSECMKAKDRCNKSVNVRLLADQLLAGMKEVQA